MTKSFNTDFRISTGLPITVPKPTNRKSIVTRQCCLNVFVIFTKCWTEKLKNLQKLCKTFSFQPFLPVLNSCPRFSNLYLPIVAEVNFLQSSTYPHLEFHAHYWLHICQFTLGLHTIVITPYFWLQYQKRIITIIKQL